MVAFMVLPFYGSSAPPVSGMKRGGGLPFIALQLSLQHQSANHVNVDQNGAAILGGAESLHTDPLRATEVSAITS